MGVSVVGGGFCAAHPPPGAWGVGRGLPHCWPGGDEAGMAAAIAAECPFFSLFFLRNSSCSILPAPYKEGPALSHSPPLQLDWGLSRSGHVSAQPSTLRSRCTRSPWVYHFVLIPLPVTPRHQVSWCCSNLVWQGALNPESKSP